MNSLLYPVIAEYDPAAEAWSILAPDFPEIASAADTHAEIGGQASDAVVTAIEFRRSRGEALPTPTEDAAGLTVAWGSLSNNRLVFVAVAADPPAPEFARINVSLDKALLARIDAAAERRGMTRSGFLAEGGKAMLAKEAKARLRA